MTKRPTTYARDVRTFDHTALASVPGYHKLRQALSDFANEANATLDDLLTAARDMVLTAPYGDCCEMCRRDTDRQASTLVTAWPHAVVRDGGWLTCWYRCLVCGYVWACGYSAAMPEMV